MIKNPFPGPQPYRSSDRKLFHGRDDLARKLESVILAARCITVHGPSGAGKSSLVQAAVLPMLVESHDVRVVRVDAWPEGEVPNVWFAQTIFHELRLGNVPTDQSATDAILGAARRAARASDRLVIVYLDQMEQLFFAGRSSDEAESLFAALQSLVDLPVRSLRVVLSLREDYLGRFRDRLRDRGRLLENTFRVGPLSVQELTTAVCQAARSGEPSQEWSTDTMRTLMLQVRVPGQAATDEAEGQAAYAQVVCRALFHERANEETSRDEDIEAEPILRRYLDSTMSGLGELEEPAQRLLADHFVSADGSRTLRTEKELLRILPDEQLFPILKALESAAILHAEEHQGSRYFEIGHDWLARKVFEERAARATHEAARKREEEQRKQFEIQQKEAADRLEKVKVERRHFALIASGAIVFSIITSVLGVSAWRSQKAAEAARRDATAAQFDAVRKRIEASDQRLLAGYAAMTSLGHHSDAIKLLPEVKFPASVEGWLSVASDALSENTLRVTLSGHTGPLVAAEFSPNGKRVLTASSDGTARVWNADGDGVPVVFSGHDRAILSATWSPDGTRILTTSTDGTARLWAADGETSPIEIAINAGPIWTGAFSPGGNHIALGVQDGSVRIAKIDGQATVQLPLPEKNPGGVRAVAFFPNDEYVLGAANNGSVHLWALNTQEKPTELGQHDEKVESLVVSADGTMVLTAAGDSFAKLFRLKGKTVDTSRLFSCGQGRAIQSDLSPDGLLAAVSCNDFKVRIFSTLGEAAPIILEGATDFITDISFRPDGKFVAIASRDSVARVFSVQGGPPRLQLRGHLGAIGVVSFSADGKRLVTGASDDRSKEFTAKVWNTESLDSLPAPPRTSLPHHAVAIRKDGQFVAAAYDDDIVRVRRVDGRGQTVELVGHDGWISRIAWAPDNERLVTASFDATARVWRADGIGGGIVLGGKTNDGHKSGIRHASFSNDGLRVVTASEDRTAKVWHANITAKPIATLGTHEDWVTWAVFSPDGRQVATASQDQNVRLFYLDKPESPSTFFGHRGAVNSVMFSPDGQRIASASNDGTVHIFSTAFASRTPPVVLNGNGTGAMLSAVWSSDGQRVAAASSDHLVYVWNADGQSDPSVLVAPQNVIVLHFMDHDKTLMAVFEDGSTRQWRIDIPGLLAALRTAHSDCLPASMRKKFLEESEVCAANAFDTCESNHGRRPAPQKIAECNELTPMKELERLSKLVETDANQQKRDQASIFEGSILDLWHMSRPPLPPVPINLPLPQRSLKDLGPDGCHVRVVVLPGDANVEVDGKPVRRNDGAVDLMGKRGDVVRLRVSRQGLFVEADVKIEVDGAIPPVIVLPPDAMAKSIRH